MNQVIENILDIIQDYRKDELELIIDEAHVKRWVNQFDVLDREFILSELLHLLSNSYLSKNQTLEILAKDFETYRRDFKYKSVVDFLAESRFLDCQADEKSQKVLLTLIEEVLKEHYDLSYANCGTKIIKNWIYVDDVLASGGTYRDDILNEITEYGLESFIKSEIRIISSFFIYHTWGANNVRYAIKQKLKQDINDRIYIYGIGKIDNNPRLHSYYNPNPMFNHAFSLESQKGKDFLQFIEDAFERDYDMKNENFAFRQPGHPKNEVLFSSPENRNRYEYILLSKGIEIIRSIGHLKAQGLRPLGMTPPSYKTLGTGTHFFTWRNISNTCPIVYWWGSNDWYPLFPVVNRGR